MSFMLGFIYIAAFYLASASIASLTALLAAFWQTSVKSAPENPSVIYPTKFMSTSLETGDFLKFAFNILTLDGKSGNGIYIN